MTVGNVNVNDNAYIHVKTRKDLPLGMLGEAFGVSGGKCLVIFESQSDNCRCAVNLNCMLCHISQT